ncbi:hypothetical protein ATI61_108235 [Archangium gephyra]|uniref:Uncharacterized protein n=1 Tax=Archangium gephyra TaxID=48 RepID=A0AAC8Q7T5_9BACT|nr:hypothetical protein [Archangium gephyra]AKJ02379.1 Hypothetical protein AA314_04005 [Archangium gephyra]REG28695.1 hypothetical protein ATI61_108235 [Archangium gephyra]
MPRTSTLAGITVLLAFLGWQWLEHRSLEEHHQRQQEELEATRRELREVARALREQQARLERLTGEVARPLAFAPGQTVAFPVEPPASGPGVERPASPAPPERSMPPSEQEMVARLEEAVHGEPVDPHWSRQAEDLARARLERTLTTSRLVSVHCGASLCRLETAHPSQEALEQFREQVLMASEPVLWNGATYSSVQGDARAGTLVTVSYVARESRPLPMLERP